MKQNEKYNLIVSALLIAILLVFQLGLRVGVSWTGQDSSISPGYVEGFAGKFSEIYWNDANRTDTLANPDLPASYIIETDGTTITAKNCSTGQIDYSGTDASTIIQNAIDALPAEEKGKIFIKKGAYKITTEIDVNHNGAVHITGEGKEHTYNKGGTVLYTDSSFPSDSAVLHYTSEVEHKRHHNVLENLGIYGKNATAAIKISGGLADSRFSNLMLYSAITDRMQDGIKLTNSITTMWNVLFEWVFIEEFERNALDIRTNHFEDITFRDCTFYASGDNGIFFGSTMTKPKAMRFVRCLVNNNGYWGAYLNKVNGIDFDKCTFYGNNQEEFDTGADIYIFGSSANIRITDCNFRTKTVPEKAKYRIIIADTADYIAVTGNYFDAAVTDYFSLTTTGTHIYIHHQLYGFITENQGTQTCADNENIAHGLAGIPTYVEVTPMNDTYDSVPVIATVDWSNVDATNIKVGLYWVNGTAISDDVILVAWRAEYEP